MVLGGGGKISWWENPRNLILVLYAQVQFQVSSFPQQKLRGKLIQHLTSIFQKTIFTARRMTNPSEHLALMTIIHGVQLRSKCAPCGSSLLCDHRGNNGGSSMPAALSFNLNKTSLLSYVKRQEKLTTIYKNCGKWSVLPSSTLESIWTCFAIHSEVNKLPGT
jgi:hypothetical protein